MIFYFWLVTLFAAVKLVVYAEILTFDKSAVPTTPQPTESVEGQSHLPLSSLFSQSNKYKCMIEGKKEHCTHDDVTYLVNKFGEPTAQSQPYTTLELKTKENQDGIKTTGAPIKDNVYGPRFQPIHLALPRLAMHKVGYEETISFNNRQMKLKTISHLPFIFEVTNFLSSNETDLIVDMATEKGLKERVAKPQTVNFWEEMSQRLFDGWDVDFDGKISKKEFEDLKELDVYLLSKEDVTDLFSTVDEDEDGFLSFGELSKGGLEQLKEALEKRENERVRQKSKGGFETWLWHDEDELLAYENLLEDFHQRIERITNIPEELIQRSEPINVQKHEKSAFSPCQQDSEPTDPKQKCCTYGNSECRNCRYMSIHMFLSDNHKGGELVFPIADNETFQWQKLKHDLLRKCERKPNVTSSNLVVPPARGKAVFWYNHEVSPHTGWMGQLEARAISSVAPVLNKNAWSAKMWLNIIGDGVQELKPWRMASNWLKSPNKNNALIERLRNDYFLEEKPYLHIYRQSYKQRISPLKTLSKENVFLAPLAVDTLPKINAENEKKKENIKKEKSEEIVAKEASVVKGPIAPDEGVNQSPLLGFHHKKRHEIPLGPPKRPLDPQTFTGKKVIENALLKASLLLLEELERDELEILARTLHDKLQLQCIPLIVNPIR